MTTTEVTTLVKGLTRAQKRFVLAGSKRPKLWATIRRHAKIPPTAGPVYGMRGLFDHGANWRLGYFLTPLGQQVRAALKETPDAE